MKTPPAAHLDALPGDAECDIQHFTLLKSDPLEGQQLAEGRRICNQGQASIAGALHHPSCCCRI
jgi:hypothetical protein